MIGGVVVKEEGSLCPKCGSLVIDDNCPRCDFKFSSILVCPHKIKDGTCGINKIPCNIQDMDWECCHTLRESR